MEDIASLVGVVPSTVSKVAGELAAFMGQETYDLIREAAVKMRKKGISIESAIEGAEVIDVVKEYDVEPAKAKEYVKNVLIASSGLKVPHDKVASSVKGMVQIKEKYDIEAVDAPVFADQKAAELLKMKSEASKFEVDLKSRKLNPLSIAIFDEAVETLGIEGPDDIPRAARMVERLREHDWSDDWMVETLGAVQPPEKYVKKLQSEEERLEPIVKRFKNADAIHRIIEDGTTPEMKNNLVNKIMSDARANKTDPAQVVAQIFLNYLFTKGIPRSGPVVRVMSPTLAGEPVVHVPERKGVDKTVKESEQVHFDKGRPS